MRIMWLTSRLLPDACRTMGFPQEVVGGWMHSSLHALLKQYGGAHEYLVLSSDSRRCDVQLQNVRHLSFGDGMATYGKTVPPKVEAAAMAAVGEFNPDVIHIHGTEFFYGRMSQEVYCGKPTVVSLQGVLHGYLPFVVGALSPKEVFWNQFNVRRYLKGQTVFSEQTHWRKLRVPQEELAFKAHCHFIGRTDWDRAWVRALNPMAHYHAVNETLRTPFYAANRRKRTSIKPRSIYCSAAAGYPLKGAHVLFRAVSYLKDKYPDISVRICAAERVSRKASLISILMTDQYASYLRHLVRALGIERHVIGLPSLSAEEVAKELAQAETFVLPSFCENSPNSLGEAQLIGTPAIATFAGGVPSVLKDGVEGRLVPSGDPASLAAMIDWYFSHPDDADAYAGAARMSAMVRHDPILNAEATMNVYNELCCHVGKGR